MPHPVSVPAGTSFAAAPSAVSFSQRFFALACCSLHTLLGPLSSFNFFFGFSAVEVLYRLQKQIFGGRVSAVCVDCVRACRRPCPHYPRSFALCAALGVRACICMTASPLLREGRRKPSSVAAKKKKKKKKKKVLCVDT
eukprot:Opistho-1_new@24086